MAVLPILHALKKASKDLQNNSMFVGCQNETKSAIEALLEMGAKANDVISVDPNLCNLSQLLSKLETLLEKLEKSQGYDLRSLIRRQITNYKILQVAYAIESELQGYIDRLSVVELVTTLEESSEEDEQLKVLVAFEARLSIGFDKDFQELVLRAKIFSILEFLLCDSSRSIRVRDQAALDIFALVKFNKDVFVGLVLMGPTIRVLISMSTPCSIKVLSSLIRFIKTPLIDEMESNGEITMIINLLSSEDISIRAAALYCIFEIAFFGREEVIETMLGEDLIKKLMNLQRLEVGTNIPDEIEGGTSGETYSKLEMEDEEDDSPFENCVARFAVQIEVGEGLESREKREVKLEILRMVREASVSEAEASAIVAQVLWGSSP
ncbi:hypothetical protein UlMin_035971 [Ulmus minor]